MSGTKKTIRFDETLLTDALFVADYQEKHFAAYVRHCVRMETQKRLKDIERRTNEEIHVIHVKNYPQRSGNESDNNFALRQLIREILINEMSRLAFKGKELGNEEDS